MLVDRAMYCFELEMPVVLPVPFEAANHPNLGKCVSNVECDMSDVGAPFFFSPNILSLLT
jgi:hypothetical protein